MNDRECPTRLGYLPCASESPTLIEQVQESMVVLADTAFHSAQGDLPNLKLCPRGTWNDRMIIETILSMLTTICHFKKVFHRMGGHFEARLAYTMALFNILVQSIIGPEN